MGCHGLDPGAAGPLSRQQWRDFARGAAWLAWLGLLTGPIVIGLCRL